MMVVVDIVGLHMDLWRIHIQYKLVLKLEEDTKNKVPDKDLPMMVPQMVEIVMLDNRHQGVYMMEFVGLYQIQEEGKDYYMLLEHQDDGKRILRHGVVVY